MLLPKKLRVIIILFLLIDLAISFNQYYNTPIDGDLTSIVWPAEKYRSVLNDPIGVSAISSNTKHGDTNRFFSIATTFAYFKTIPFVSQLVMSPISSIYFSSALLKLLIHIFIVLLLSTYITGRLNFKDDKFILSSLLITIFFQVGGYGSTMGIIDSAISYTISYSLPLAFVLLLLFPLALNHFHDKKVKLNSTTTLIYSIVACIIAFFGTQIPILVVSLLLLLILAKFIDVKRNFNLSNLITNKRYRFILLILLTFCLYSLALSFYNIERNLIDISIFESYRKIPIGLFNIFFGKPGLWILDILILTNTIVMKKSGSQNFTSFAKTLKWASVFILIFVLLLPVDGYYEFRPNIIRRDNFLPCILLLVFLFVQSAIYLVEHYKNEDKIRLITSYLLVVILLFTIADSPSLRKDNCQRASLEMLTLSDDKITRLSDQCTIASWYIIYDSKDSEVNAKVFNYWNITDKPKLYYQN